MDVFALAFFFQSFIDSTRYALILSLLLYFVMYFLSMACIKETASKSIKIGLSFFPPVIVEVGIVMIGKFESRFRKFHPNYFTNTYTKILGSLKVSKSVDTTNAPGITLPSTFSFYVQNESGDYLQNNGTFTDDEDKATYTINNNGR